MCSWFERGGNGHLARRGRGTECVRSGVRPRHKRSERAGIGRAGRDSESRRFARSKTRFLTPHGKSLLANRLLHKDIPCADPSLLFLLLVDATASRFWLCKADRSTTLLYIDRQLVHEVTSPQAFKGLVLANYVVRRPNCTLITVAIVCPPRTRPS